MQLNQNSPIYQCQALDSETKDQCAMQAVGMRKFKGELYHACVEHQKPMHNYIPISALPVLTRVWEPSQATSVV